MQTDYRRVQDRYFDYWRETETKFKLPYYPNVTMGWDSSPRTVQTDEYANVGYPFMNTISGNTPERFRDALLAVRQRLEASPNSPRILNLNAATWSPTRSTVSAICRRSARCSAKSPATGKKTV